MEDITIEQLQEENLKLQADYAVLDQNYSDALAVNETLTKEIERLSTPATSEIIKASKPAEYKGLSFKVDGDEYGFNFSKTVHNKVPVTAVEVCASPEIQKELIAKNAGMIFKK